MEMKSILLAFVLLSFIAPSFAGVVKCEKLRWKLIEKGTPATYRGSIKAGSADYIEIEVRSSRRIIGQDTAFPNGGGNWEMYVYGDIDIRKQHKEKFYCHKY